jgi:hypothetical protein
MTKSEMIICNTDSKTEIQRIPLTDSAQIQIPGHLLFVAPPSWAYSEGVIAADTNPDSIFQATLVLA